MIDPLTHFDSDVPRELNRRLHAIGGSNPYGWPMFRLVLGKNRVMPVFGQWEDWEELEVADPLSRVGARKAIRLKRSVIETREIPKYLPIDAYHLERWNPPESYGSPENWRKAGEEIVGMETLDTSGPFPSQGDYELCFCLTIDGTHSAPPAPTESIAQTAENLVYTIIASKNNYSYAQRRAAIDQAMADKDRNYTRVAEDQLRDGLRPFRGENFVTVPAGQTFTEGGRIIRPD